MSDPHMIEAMRDAERRAAARERANDDLKAKCQELREILNRFGVKERGKGEYVMDYGKLIATLGPKQALELAEELAAKGYGTTI